jgi:hypothetical protein
MASKARAVLIDCATYLNNVARMYGHARIRKLSPSILSKFRRCPRSYERNSRSPGLPGIPDIINHMAERKLVESNAIPRQIQHGCIYNLRFIFSEFCQRPQQTFSASCSVDLGGREGKKFHELIE